MKTVQIKSTQRPKALDVNKNINQALLCKSCNLSNSLTSSRSASLHLIVGSPAKVALRWANTGLLPKTVYLQEENLAKPRTIHIPSNLFTFRLVLMYTSRRA